MAVDDSRQVGREGTHQGLHVLLDNTLEGVSHFLPKLLQESRLGIRLQIVSMGSGVWGVRRPGKDLDPVETEPVACGMRDVGCRVILHQGWDAGCGGARP